MATFLLEIGTEELPADFAGSALDQLEQRVRRDLVEARLSSGTIRVDGTPRRLVLRLEDLPARQEDRSEERKGPPAQQAFRDGVSTPAAVGFARRCGVEPEDLEVRDTEKGAFVFARTLERGRATAEVLAELAPAWIWSLQGRRFMRWGDGESRFSRPIRWLVALLDGAVVPITLADCDPPVRSDRLSRGHRLHADSVVIDSAASYGSTLAAASVQVDRQARATAIRQAITTAAEASNARPDLPDSLFEELLDLVESPRLIEGAIEERFLALPPEVLSTVMRAHQRYVPLQRQDAPADSLALEAGSQLLPRFLCIGNGLDAAAATIRRGNERVLRARLADAEFFLAADRSTASIDRREQLARVTFAEGLGSLRDRVERLEWCTDVLLERLPLNPPTADHARRAVHLCKHDLVSQMVGEFPELQGVMGGKYLLAEGEPRAVALAVLEHYLPRGAGDALPGSDAGAVVALAERLELLLSIYAKGERPSGSSDPYALRRAGNGLLQILWERGWRLDLVALLKRCSGHWAELFPGFAVDGPALASELAEFLRQRLVSLLEEEGFPVDLIQAVAGEGLPLDRVLADPADARSRVKLLCSLIEDGELAAVQAVVQRASRLAEKGNLPESVRSPEGVVDAALFEKNSEAEMLKAVQALAPFATGSDSRKPRKIRISKVATKKTHSLVPAWLSPYSRDRRFFAVPSNRYSRLACGLANNAPILERFFDGSDSVLVMADDPAVRANRLNLLAVLRNQASVLADFTRLRSREYSPPKDSTK
jgi:glycyl-tRNA synthetase beta chain